MFCFRFQYSMKLEGLQVFSQFFLWSLVKRARKLKVDTFTKRVPAIGDRCYFD